MTTDATATGLADIPRTAGRRRGRILAALVWLLAAGRPGAEVLDGHPISAMAAGSDPGFGSFLFVAERPTGTIRYQAVGDEPRIGFLEVERMKRLYGGLDEPVALTYGDRKLYVAERAGRRILEFDVREGGYRTLLEGPPLEDPAGLAVSPRGLVVVADRGLRALIGITRDGEVRVLENGYLTDVRDLGFVLHEQLLLLDRRAHEVFSLPGEWFDAGHRKAGVEVTSLDLSPRLGELRGLAVESGIAYLFGRWEITALVVGSRDLLPIAGGPRPVARLAANDRHLFVLEEEGPGIHWFPRPVPVDVALDGAAEDSNRALILFYLYLRENQLLPVREDVVDRRYGSLEEYLLERRVLLVPLAPEWERREAERADEVRIRRGWEQKIPVRVPEERESPSSAELFHELFCQLNPDFCAGRSPLEVLTFRPTPGLELAIPELPVESRLRRARVALGGRPVAEMLEELVPSRELRDRVVEAETIRRLNPGHPAAESGSREELLDTSEGLIVLPAEAWTLTAAVPAADLAEDSPLRDLQRRVQGLAFYPREAFEAKGHSLPPRPPPDPPADDLCAVALGERRKLERAIGYPHDYPPAHEAAAVVGVLEDRDSVQRGHIAFLRVPDRPAWHSLDDLGSLIPQPRPASLPSATPDCEAFDRRRDHGTHVSSLIGARPGDCGSGLLPRSKLVLVDTHNAGDISSDLRGASFADIRVFNVSQGFPPTETTLGDLKQLITDHLSYAVFVVAAGNDGKDLDVESPPVPVAWSDAGNIVTVTASTFDNTILPEDQEIGSRGANHGKKHVDLVAPGKEILGATGPNCYGRASGTSQAAPLVTAAAALLVESGVYPAREVRSRLIATAAWGQHLRQDVWGGLLDFRAAVMFPQKNLVRKISDPEELYRLELVNEPVIEIKAGAEIYPRSGEGHLAPRKIPFKNVLSLRWREDGHRYRVVYVDQETREMKILLRAEIDDARNLFGGRPRMKCQLWRWKPGSEDFEEVPEDCPEEGMSVTQIQLYVKASPYHAHLPG